MQWYQSLKLSQLDDDVRFEAASALAEMMAAQESQQPQQQQQQQPANSGPGAAKQILATAVEMSRNNPYWHCRLLFQLAVQSNLPLLPPLPPLPGC